MSGSDDAEKLSEDTKFLGERWQAKWDALDERHRRLNNLFHANFYLAVIASIAVAPMVIKPYPESKTKSAFLGLLIGIVYLGLGWYSWNIIGERTSIRRDKQSLEKEIDKHVPNLIDKSAEKNMPARFLSITLIVVGAGAGVISIGLLICWA